MALIPTAGAEQLSADFEIKQEPGYTYRMNVDREDGLAGNISGHVDNREALEQAVYKILNTERGEYPEIYGDQYGVEMDDLFGMPIPYVIPELDRRVTEALLQDDRVESVDGFKFDLPRKGVVHMEFTVHSIYGDDLTITKEVEVA